MISIFILLALALALPGAMLAKRGRRKYRKYIRGNIDSTDTLTQLAANTLAAVLTDTVEDTTYVSSMKAIWSMTRYTNNDGTGPIICGIAHSDYTNAEVEEWIENTGAWTRGDLRSQEIAKRKIRRVGAFVTLTDGGPNNVYLLNNGRPIHTKCGWVLSEGDGLRIWYYNAGITQISATTNPIVDVSGFANLWPM